MKGTVKYEEVNTKAQVLNNYHLLVRLQMENEHIKDHINDQLRILEDEQKTLYSSFKRYVEEVICTYYPAISGKDLNNVYNSVVDYCYADDFHGHYLSEMDIRCILDRYIKENNVL